MDDEEITHIIGVVVIMMAHYYKMYVAKERGANFRDLPGVIVLKDNTVAWNPEVERIMLASGKPLVPNYAMKFCGGKSLKYVQVGNAVAIPVGRALGFGLGMACCRRLTGDGSLFTFPPGFTFSNLEFKETAKWVAK
ncbi:DNA (cytosine-5)-methyltransferase 1 [Acorus calamus]|uniref:DNA (Cytosine-5)-methyltransferase 1 n=1 Tax=Acorus calamus TaxID=4465 RepID=A0AAV9DPU5_ACOCL|nr:DNA (cytosine-5)-methyltransferase 1 [Acorus calamus]